MKISSQEEYGLRCTLQLARLAPKASLTIPEIAQREGLSTAYVAKLLHLLRQAAMVQSVRGRSGGYVLSRPGSDVSVAEVLQALGNRTWEPESCARFAGSHDVCVRTDGCSIRSLWGTLDAVVGDLLRQVSLADLIAGRVQHGSRPSRSTEEEAPPSLIELVKQRRSDASSALIVGAPLAEA